jgi:hypothetical protein
MKNLFYSLLFLLSLAACQNSGTPDGQAEQTDSTTVEEEAPVATTSCYIHAVGQDTTWVQLTITVDGSVSGTYDWIPYEKDSARGTLSGKKEGDLLKLTYDYMIEGSQQQEEKLMKLTGDQLADGEGELVEGEGGMLKLKDPASVAFQPMTKVDCK